MTLRNTAVVLVVLSFALSPAFGQVWASKELDSGTKDEGFEWPYPSLRVNNDGDVFISYYHDKDSTVKVARWSEQGWSTETVGSSNGGYTSLDLDPYGRPRIAYESDGDIRYAWRSGSNWQTQGLGSGSLGANSALAVDSDGKAHIVCSTASGLKYMRGAGSQAWESDTVDTGNLKGASIALDAAGEAHFSYQAHLESDVEIRYAKHNSSPWDIPFEITTVGSTESLGLTSICLTEGNVPHIAYRTDGFTMAHTSLAGSEWATEEVEVAEYAGTGWAPSLIADSQDNLHLSYRGRQSSSASSGLKYATLSGEGWDIGMLDYRGAHYDFRNVALTADADDGIHAAYTYPSDVSNWWGVVYAEKDPKWTLFALSQTYYNDDNVMRGLSAKGLTSSRRFWDTPAAARGKNGIVYALNTYRDRIVRINPQSHEQIGVFAEDVSIASPAGMGVGDDGSVFLWDSESKSMFQFAPDGSLLEQVANPDISEFGGMMVGSDGLVYMTARFAEYDDGGDDGDDDDPWIWGSDNFSAMGYSTSDCIIRYDPVQRWFMGIFADGGGLDAPGELEFGPDGNLYVTSTGTNEVLRYDGETGEFIDAFITADDGQVFQGALAFGPEGDLYLAWSDGYIHRYDGLTGDYVGEFAYRSGCNGLLMVPEPATAVMLAFGGLLLMRRRRR